MYIMRQVACASGLWTAITIFLCHFAAGDIDQSQCKSITDQTMVRDPNHTLTVVSSSNPGITSISSMLLVLKCMHSLGWFPLPMRILWTLVSLPTLLFRIRTMDTEYGNLHRSYEVFQIFTLAYLTKSWSRFAIAM